MEKISFEQINLLKKTISFQEENEEREYRAILDIISDSEKQDFVSKHVKKSLNLLGIKVKLDNLYEYQLGKRKEKPTFDNDDKGIINFANLTYDEFLDRSICFEDLKSLTYKDVEKYKDKISMAVNVLLKNI